MAQRQVVTALALFAALVLPPAVLAEAPEMGQNITAVVGQSSLRGAVQGQNQTQLVEEPQEVTAAERPAATAAVPAEGGLAGANPRTEVNAASAEVNSALAAVNASFASEACACRMAGGGCGGCRWRPTGRCYRYTCPGGDIFSTFCTDVPCS